MPSRWRSGDQAPSAPITNRPRQALAGGRRQLDRVSADLGVLDPRPASQLGAGPGGEVDERGVELAPRRDGGVQPVVGEVEAERVTALDVELDAADGREPVDRLRREAERGQLPQRHRGEAVAAALVTGEHRPVDQRDLEPGPGEDGRRGCPGRPCPHDEDVPVGSDHAVGAVVAVVSGGGGGWVGGGAAGGAVVVVRLGSLGDPSQFKPSGR